MRIRFVDKLPKEIGVAANRSKWGEAAYSMSRPNRLGKWAIVDTKDTYKPALMLKYGLKHKPAFRSYTVETAVRRNAGGKFDVYARITGIKPAEGEEEQ